jgi:hypothetical protein
MYFVLMFDRQICTERPHDGFVFERSGIGAAFSMAKGKFGMGTPL